MAVSRLFLENKEFQKLDIGTKNQLRVICDRETNQDHVYQTLEKMFSHDIYSYDQTHKKFKILEKFVTDPSHKGRLCDVIETMHENSNGITNHIAYLNDQQRSFLISPSVWNQTRKISQTTYFFSA